MFAEITGLGHIPVVDIGDKRKHRVCSVGSSEMLAWAFSLPLSEYLRNVWLLALVGKRKHMRTVLRV